jgi:hypothetical protein
VKVREGSNLVEGKRLTESRRLMDIVLGSVEVMVMVKTRVKVSGHLTALGNRTTMMIL